MWWNGAEVGATEVCRDSLDPEFDASFPLLALPGKTNSLRVRERPRTTTVWLAEIMLLPCEIQQPLSRERVCLAGAFPLVVAQTARQRVYLSAVATSDWLRWPFLTLTTTRTMLIRTSWERLYSRAAACRHCRRQPCSRTIYNLTIHAVCALGTCTSRSWALIDPHTVTHVARLL